MSRRPRTDELRLAAIVQATRLIASYTADGEEKYVGSKRPKMLWFGNSK
jgi:hypothetical protein